MRIKCALILFFLCSLSCYSQERFGENLCHENGYHCLTIKNNQSWRSLFSNAEERDLVKRVNRMNTPLKPGLIIAVPNQLDTVTIYDVSPFPQFINGNGEKTIYVSQSLLAWAAYDEQGELIWWGPISTGADRCSGVKGNCHTPSGEYHIIRKQDYYCISTEFPKHADGTKGGAEMPYCMHFFQGYALHGSSIVPGYRDSHGCVRMFVEDARWLNEEFITTNEEEYQGTRVIIQGLNPT